MSARRDELRLYLNNNPSKSESSTKAKAELAAIDLKLTESAKALLTAQKQIIEQMLYQKAGKTGDILIAALFIALVVAIILIIRQRGHQSRNA
jgi:H+/gluconate symporter-like permease